MKPPSTLGLLLAVALPLAVEGPSAADNELLKLRQWDWQQALEAPRQGYLQRNRDATPARQRQIDRQLDQERRQQRQLFEQQRRGRTMLPQSGHGGGQRQQDSLRLQQRQTGRFKAQSDNLRLQQDIRRRAADR